MVADTSPYPSPYPPRSHDVLLKAWFFGLFFLHVNLSASPICLIRISPFHVILSSIVSAKFFFQSNTSFYRPLYLPYFRFSQTRHFYPPTYLPLAHRTDSHFIFHLINTLRTSNRPLFFLIRPSICQFSLNKTRELYLIKALFFSNSRLSLSSSSSSHLLFFSP
jgi:hypothetical protein